MVAVTRDAGFAALAPAKAGYGSSGKAITHALQVCTGCEALVLNIDCHGYGSVAVELQNANGTALPGYSLKEAMLIAGRSSTNAVVFWRSAKDSVTAGHSPTPTSDIRPAVVAGGVCYVGLGWVRMHLGAGVVTMLALYLAVIGGEYSSRHGREQRGAIVMP